MSPILQMWKMRPPGCYVRSGTTRSGSGLWHWMLGAALTAEPWCHQLQVLDSSVVMWKQQAERVKRTEIHILSPTLA